ncbi:MAG: alginate lyase family protein [Pseudomonadota bacterium]
MNNSSPEAGHSVGPASMLANARRAFEFGRHIPPRQIARRLELKLKRSFRPNLSDVPSRKTYPKQSETGRPRPLFPSRSDLAPKKDGDQLVFTFLNRSVAFDRALIDWAAPSCDPKDQLWRMNLHAMEFLEGCDDEDFCRFVDDWLRRDQEDRNQTFRDAWNSQTLSTRCTVWLQELAKRDLTLNPAWVRKVQYAVVDQIRFLTLNLETDIGGNHFIRNIKALIWASAVFTGTEPDRWRSLGLKHLRSQLQRQILADGVHCERSPSYHAIVFADLLEIRHAFGSDPIDGPLDEALADMAQALLDLSHPDGKTALLNDAGLSMARSPQICLAAHQQIFGRNPVRNTVFSYPEAGYFGISDQETYLVADCGRIAPDELPAHGHADVLSFELSVGHQRFVVDQGVFEYSEGEKRQLSREAKSHNTLSLDGVDQADFFSSFRCGRRPKVEVREWQRTKTGMILEGAHDGYSHLPGRPAHVRRFEASAGLIRIVDHIEGECLQSAEIAFLIHPDVAVSVASNTARLSSSTAVINMTARGDVRALPAVWWPDMGVEIPTLRLTVSLSQVSEPWTTEFQIQAGI